MKNLKNRQNEHRIIVVFLLILFLINNSSTDNRRVIAQEINEEVSYQLTSYQQTISNIYSEDTAGDAFDIQVKGDYAYIADFEIGLAIMHGDAIMMRIRTN